MARVQTELMGPRPWVNGEPRPRLPRRNVWATTLQLLQNTASRRGGEECHWTARGRLLDPDRQNPGIEKRSVVRAERRAAVTFQNAPFVSFKDATDKEEGNPPAAHRCSQSDPW